MTGTDIKVRHGAAPAVLRIKKVEVNDAVAPEIDETDSESGGFGECDESGVAQAEVTFEGWVRRADVAQPKRGDLLTNVLIAWDGNVAAPVAAMRHLFPRLKILSVVKMGETRGSISFTINCKSSGPYKAMGEE